MNLNLSQSREPYCLNPFFPSFPFLFFPFPFPFLHYFLFFITDSFYFSSLFFSFLSPFNPGINLGDLPVPPFLSWRVLNPRWILLSSLFYGNTLLPPLLPHDAVLNPPCSRGVFAHAWRCFFSQVFGTTSCTRSTGQEEQCCSSILLHTFIGRAWLQRRRDPKPRTSAAYIGLGEAWLTPGLVVLGLC